MIPSGVDAGFLVTLPPERAIEHLGDKGMQVPPDWNWWETLADVHADLFTVAKGRDADVLDAIRASLAQAFGGPGAMPDGRGITREEFLRRVAPKLVRLGWWGEQIIIDADGNAQLVELGSLHRLRQIYRSVAMAAYNAGRWEAQIANADQRPYWMRVAVRDSNTRPEHRALDGRVYRWDDPIWRTMYPPDDFNCRCRVRTLSEEQMEREGLRPDSSEGRLERLTDVEVGMDPRTGEVVTRDVTAIRLPGAGPDGEDLLYHPRPGWDGNPADYRARVKAAAEGKIDVLPEDVRRVVLDALERGLGG